LLTVKTSPNLTDAAMSKLALGTKVIAEGGCDKLFHQTFGTLPGEQLKKSYACYLSTSSGPVIGTLYLSNARIAFCSDNPLSVNTGSKPQQQVMYYKVPTLIYSPYSFLICLLLNIIPSFVID
jgi:GRAM domain